ncbi:MAG: pro-sigmaK processing inhibitor BofA family protein [Clostridia bacterium]|nr:pro-sigmaK processing inhibitor BofA family protein [Clostridia bacterium]
MVSLLAFSGVVCAFISLLAMKKSKHFVKSLFLTAIQGLTALMAVNASGILTGVNLSLNALTIGSGVVFGTPGIVMNLLIKIILAT